MNVLELTQMLLSNPRSKLQFILPSGAAIPAHFHVTEVALVDKSFIDCGGTKRRTSTCQLQIWTSTDVEHRLEAEKLARIMRLAEPILNSETLSVEIEYGPEVASCYSIGDVINALGSIQFHLIGRQTDCLAKDKCGVPQAGAAQSCC